MWLPLRVFEVLFSRLARSLACFSIFSSYFASRPKIEKFHLVAPPGCSKFPFANDIATCHPHPLPSHCASVQIDKQITVLDSLIPIMEPHSVQEIKLRSATVKYNRKAIERELSNVKAMEKSSGRVFCVLSIENANKALADIQREENKLKKLTKTLEAFEASVNSTTNELIVDNNNNDSNKDISSKLLVLEDEIFRRGFYQRKPEQPRKGSKVTATTKKMPPSTKNMDSLKQRAKSFDTTENLGYLREDVELALNVRRTRNMTMEEEMIVEAEVSNESLIDNVDSR